MALKVTLKTVTAHMGVMDLINDEWEEFSVYFLDGGEHCAASEGEAQEGKRDVRE